MTQELPRPYKRRQERITSEFNMSDAWPKSGDDKAGPAPIITVMAFSPDAYTEKQISEAGELISFFANWPVVWVNIDPMCEGPRALAVIDRFAKIFSLHELAVEDVVNVHQRSKVEEYAEHLFVVIRMLIEKNSTDTEQLSLFLSKNYVLTFREVPKDCLEPVRDKIRKARGRIRNEGADYLMYSILDAVVDSYFPLVSGLAERIDRVEDQTLEGSDQETADQMYQIRRDLLSIRRAVWPAREALTTLTRDTSPLVSETTRVYLRDCYDHAVRIIDFVEMHREIASALMELYYTRLNLKMNEVMKVLTVITTLLLPPTLIAGIYGMNFNSTRSPLNMPELEWYYGYPVALVTMVIVSFGLYAYLQHKGWLGGDRHR